jgi:hypothetical protein
MTLLNAKMEKDIQAGRCYLSNASNAAQLFCVPKPGEPHKPRFVVDLRSRNKNTVADIFPLPDQQLILNTLGRAKYRSAIDLYDAYWQVRIHKDDEHKSTFMTPTGTYNSTVMQQGDRNAPATFCRLIQHVMQPFLFKFVMVYLDDIFVYSNTKEDHEDHIRQVCQKLKDFQLWANPHKSQFFTPKLKILGHFISDAGIEADPDKLFKICNWPQLKNSKEAERFIATVSYLRRFFKNIASELAPITDLTGNAKFRWTELEQTAFDKTKELAENPPILKALDPDSAEPIFLFTDASTVGTGAMC